jgi:hypothetical protein
MPDLDRPGGFPRRSLFERGRGHSPETPLSWILQTRYGRGVDRTAADMEDPSTLDQRVTPAAGKRNTSNVLDVGHLRPAVLGWTNRLN